MEDVDGVVDAHRAGADAFGNLERTGYVPTVDRATEPVGRVVGDAYGIVGVLVGQDRQHRPEDLLSGDAHVVADAAEDGGLDEIAAFELGRAPATDGEDRA